MMKRTAFNFFAGLVAALLVPLAAQPAEIYRNRLSTGTAIVPIGTYGAITVSTKGYAARKFPSEVADVTASTTADVSGSYAKIIQSVDGKKDVQTHTVAGWFRVTRKSGADTLLWAALSYKAGTAEATHAGYKVSVTSDGKLKVVKTSIPLADYGDVVLSTSAVPNGEWFYLSLAVTKDSSARTATVKATVNGTAFAMGSGTFATNLDGSTSCVSFRMGDGISCAGLRVDDTAVTDAATVKTWATSTTYLVAASSDIAEWTGAANDGDVTNAANWLYTGISAAPAQKVPGTSAKVMLGGLLWFNATEGKTFKCKSNGITLTDHVALVQDCDWSALPYVPTFGGFMIDLSGKSLTLAKVPTSTSTAGTITNSTTDAKSPGRLAVTVASGSTVNSYLTLAGNLRLVKEGAGTYIGRVKNQAYTGGTVVDAGTLKSYAAENELYYGATNTPVTVNAGGTLDIAGKYRWCVHDIVLNGGTVANSSTSQTTYTNPGLGNITLTADSTVALKYHILVNADGSKLDLGGHTLAIERRDTTGNVLFSIEGDYAAVGGTIACGPGIRFSTRSQNNVLSGVRLELNGCYSWLKKYDISVDELVDNATNTEDDKLITVTRRFASAGKYDNVMLADGATLDLNGNEGVFSTASEFSGRSLSFDTGARITVDISGRTFNDGDKVIAWSAKPSATFTWDAETMKKGVSSIADTDGLYYGGDPGSDKVSVAHWTNASRDGNIANTANWACTNRAGYVVEDALPGTETTVYLSGATPIRAVTPVTWGGICLTGALTGDFDLSGVTLVKFADGAAFDLNGHVVRVGPLDGSSSSVAISDFKLETTPGAFVLAAGTSVMFSGFTTDPGVRVRVAGGATLDLNGVNGTVFRAVLEDGAKIVNTGAIIDTDRTSNVGGGLELAAGATATINVANRIQLRATGNAPYPIALNGGTLVKDGVRVGLINGDITGPGTIRVTSNQFDIGGGGIKIAADATIEVVHGGAFTYLQGEATVPAIVGDGTVSGNSYYYTITRRFSGLLTVEGKGTKFASGMTIDLSNGPSVYAIPTKVTMAENSTIKIDLSGRTDLADGKQIVSWTLSTEPPETTRFSVAGAPFIAQRRDDGLYLVPAEGLVIGVR